MEKIYKICCLIMGVLTVLSLGVTLYVGATGASPAASKAGTIAVVICLAVLAVMTILAIALFKVGGRLPYKIGFYALHAGLVILIAGMILTQLGTVDNRKQYTDESGNELTTGGDWFFVGQPATSVPVGQKNLLKSGENLMLESIDTEYYEDNGMPKHYEAVLTLYDRNTGVEKEELTLTVNHPVYVNGFKVYLMGAESGAAALYIKYNPGEYVVILGTALLVFGTFCACFSGFPKRKKGGDAS